MRRTITVCNGRGECAWKRGAIAFGDGGAIANCVRVEGQSRFGGEGAIAILVKDEGRLPKAWL